jgi:hypothetical protein
MRKQPRKPGLNVVPMPAKKHETSRENRTAARNFAANAVIPGVLAAAGSSDEPRVKDGLRLVEAFLAIEDAQGRAALVTLARAYGQIRLGPQGPAAPNWRASSSAAEIVTESLISDSLSLASLHVPAQRASRP